MTPGFIVLLHALALSIPKLLLLLLGGLAVLKPIFDGATIGERWNTKFATRTERSTKAKRQKNARIRTSQNDRLDCRNSASMAHFRPRLPIGAVIDVQGRPTRS